MDTNKVREILLKHGIEKFQVVEDDRHGIFILKTEKPVFPVLLFELNSATGEVWNHERLEPKSVKTDGAIKYDKEKTQLELLSAPWLFGVGKVLTFGARKYAAHNWRKGIERSRLLGAALRHMVAYLGGENNDPETGILHLYHASCCLMFASELHETRPDLDDRYSIPEKALAPSATEVKHALDTLAGGDVDLSGSEAPLVKTEGEWIVVTIDGKDVGAFVPKTIPTGNTLPNEMYVRS